MTSRRQHVLIVGAGIMGTTLANDFARRGAQVTLIDKGDAASGATSGSFAWLTSQTRFRNAEKLGDFGEKTYFNLHRLSLSRWRYLQQITRTSLPIRWGGTLQLAVPGSQEADELAEELERRLRRGSPAYRMDVEQARLLEPAMNPLDETFIVHTPDDGMIAPVDMTRALLVEAQSLGVVYSPFDAYLGMQKRGAQYGVSSVKEERVADIVLFAGGIDNPHLIEGTKMVAPLDHSTGSVVHLAPLPPLFGKVIFSPRVHAIQRQDGRVVIAQHFTGSPLGDPTMPDPVALLEKAKSVLPGLARAEIEKVTETRRIIPVDGLPVFSRDESLPGIASITTNAAVTLAPILSQFITTEMLDGVNVDLLDPYRGGRFSC